MKSNASTDFRKYATHTAFPASQKLDFWRSNEHPCPIISFRARFRGSCCYFYAYCPIEKPAYGLAPRYARAGKRVRFCKTIFIVVIFELDHGQVTGNAALVVPI